MPAPSQSLWQQSGWPKLVFDQGVLGPALSRARNAQGRVLGKAQALGLANLGAALADIWVEEAAATARIEGEKLDLTAVRSSVARRLGMTAVGSGSRIVEGLMDLMEDATQRWQEPLTLARLCGWQAALFPTGHGGLHRIVVGAIRAGPEPMQIVSGPIARRKIHFEAPPSKRLPREVKRFLDWFEATRTAPVEGLVRAGIAHLWFEVLHPFEDGNGRVGRALVDLALAQDAQLDQRLYSVSRRLAESRNDYYAELGVASRGGLSRSGGTGSPSIVRASGRGTGYAVLRRDGRLGRGRAWAKPGRPTRVNTFCTLEVGVRRPVGRDVKAVHFNTLSEEHWGQAATCS